VERRLVAANYYRGSSNPQDLRKLAGELAALAPDVERGSGNPVDLTRWRVRRFPLEMRPVSGRQGFDLGELPMQRVDASLESETIDSVTVW
jgi:hypothetical protein